MCPVIRFGPGGAVMQISAYGLFTVLAAAAGTALAAAALRREGLGLFRSALLLLMMAAGLLIGARAWNVLANPGGYGGGMTPLSLRLAGFSLYGGIAGALAVFLAAVRLWRRRAWPLLDALVLPAAAAFALMRIGCFLNGCCGGVATRSSLGVIFPQRAGAEALPGQALPFLPSVRAVYPTQLFEAALALLALIPVFVLRARKNVPTGVPFLVYGVEFTAMRLLVLPLRYLPYRPAVIYAALIAAGLALLVFRIKKGLSSK